MGRENGEIERVFILLGNDKVKANIHVFYLKI
jgi:hypothetical protein